MVVRRVKPAALPERTRPRYALPVEGREFTEERFFAAIAESGARVLLIGRRAMVALGIPVLVDARKGRPGYPAHRSLAKEEAVTAQKLAPGVEALYLEPLPVEEFERRVRASLEELEGPELENLQELLGWFQRRYPTAKERLAYARRAYARWVRAVG
jgi:hypothetical protein